MVRKCQSNFPNKLGAVGHCHYLGLAVTVKCFKKFGPCEKVREVKGERNLNHLLQGVILSLFMFVILNTFSFLFEVGNMTKMEI